MGITKRRLEAEQADVNAELRLCIRCDNRIDIAGSQTLSWRYEHSITGPFTTIWLCEECRGSSLKRCQSCDAKVLIEPDIPVCANCLTQYESKIESTASRAICNRCGAPVEACELDIYYDTKLCGWCDHMESKAYAEESEWEPENNLRIEERRIITPEQFASSQLSIITDPRLIAHLASHPEEIRALTSRQFEELIAELLKSFGYAVKLGKGSKDGGVDVFAEKRTELGTELTIVQCKRNSAKNKVGEPIVKQLYADVTTKNATRGLVVTTSTFTKDALKLIESLKYKLSPVDFEKLKEWLEKFDTTL